MYCIFIVQINDLYHGMYGRYFPKNKENNGTATKVGFYDSLKQKIYTHTVFAAIEITKFRSSEFCDKQNYMYSTYTLLYI